MDKQKNKTARNIAHRFTSSALNHSQSYKQLTSSSTKNNQQNTTQKVTQNHQQTSDLKSKVLFDYQKVMQKQQSVQNIQSFSNVSSANSNNLNSSSSLQLSNNKSPRQFFLSASVQGCNSNESNNISHHNNRTTEQHTFTQQHQSEIEKKRLLSYLISIGKQVDLFTKYLKRYENIQGKELEVELFNFLKVCIQKTILNKEMVEEELKMTREQQERDSLIIKDQRYIIERLKNSNIMLLKELKDIKGVLNEAQSNLCLSNQNSEILEKIQQIQSTSNVEVDFEQFLSNDDCRSSSGNHTSFAFSNHTPYDPYKQQVVFVNKLPSTEKVENKELTFSFSQDNSCSNPQNNGGTKQSNTPSSDNMTQIINLKPIQVHTQNASRNQDTQLFNYSFSNNNSLLNQQEEQFEKLSLSPAHIINQVNAKKYEQQQLRGCQIMIIEDEDMQTTNNNTDSLALNEELEEKPHLMLNLTKKMDFIDCFSVNEIRSSTPIRGMIKLNSPYSTVMCQSTSNLDTVKSAEKGSLGLFSDQMKFFQTTLDSKLPPDMFLTNPKTQGSLERPQSFSCKISSQTPKHNATRSNQQYTLSQILNGGSKKDFRFLPKSGKRQSLNSHNKGSQQQAYSIDLQKQAQQQLDALRGSIQQMTLETSLGDDDNLNKLRATGEMLLDIGNLVGQIDNKSPTNEQLQQKMIQLINQDITTPQFGSPRNQNENIAIMGTFKARNRIRMI